MPVTSITQSTTSCTIIAGPANVAYTSKRVVISVATPLYKHFNFSPPLPENKTAIASGTHLGFTAKMILIYGSPWWRDLNLSGVLNSDIGPLAFTRDSSVEADSQYSLTCFLVGDPGRRWAEILTTEERKTKFLEHVNVLFAPVIKETGKPVPQPLHTIEQIWMREPYI